MRQAGNRIHRAAVALAAVCLLTCGAQARAAEVIQKPEFTVTLPDGWVEIPQDVMEKMAKNLERLAPNVPVLPLKYGFQRKPAPGKASGDPVQSPYIMVTVGGFRIPLGVLRRMHDMDLNQHAEKLKRDLPPFMSDLRYGTQEYDEQANIMWTSHQQEVQDAGKILGITGTIPTQKGVVQFIGLATEGTAASWLPEFRRITLSVKIAAPLAYQPEGELLRQAEQGDVAAQLALGDMYAGSLNAETQAEAAKWYRKAAEQGSARAQLALWDVYYSGRGVAADRAEALKWLRKSADQGYGLAQYELGRAYASGDGVKQDKDEALKLYGKAADQGVLQAAEIWWKAPPGVGEEHTRRHRLGNAELRKKLPGEWLMGLDDYTRRMPLKRAVLGGQIGFAVRFNADGTAQAHAPCDLEQPGKGTLSKSTVIASGVWRVDDSGVLAFSLTGEGEPRPFEQHGTPEFYQFDGGIEVMALRADNRRAVKLGRLDGAAVRCE